MLIIIVSFSSSIKAEQLTFVAEDYPPFEYEENGKITGFTVELLREMMEITGHKGTFNILPWARAERESQNNSHAVIHTLTRTQKREANYKWLGPIATRKVYFYRLKERKDIRINTLDEAKKYKTAVIRGHAITNYLLSKGFEEEKHLITVNNDSQRFDLLLYGRVDLMELVEPVLEAKLKASHPTLKLERVFLIDDSKGYYIGFNREQSDKVVNDFRKAFEQLKDSGKFKKLVEKYF